MSTLSKTTLSFVLCSLFCALAALLPAAAKSKAPATPPPVDPRVLITAVDPATQQISIVYKRTGQTGTYIVDQFTQVTVGSGPGTFADIKAGEQIFASVERDAHTLDSITVGPADPPPVAPATAKGKGR